MAEISSSNLDGPIVFPFSFQALPNPRIRLIRTLSFFIFSKPLTLYMKRLYRSTRDRMLGGVCAGLGEHFNVDPSVVRILWVAVTLLSLGIGIIVYIIAWIIVPEQPGNSGEVSPPAHSGS